MKKIAALALYLLAYPTFSSAQTIGTIGTSAVRSGDDFATRAFQDPWDMNERTDLGWWVNGADDPAHGLQNPPAFSGGEFIATSTNANPNVFLLETGNPNAARLGKIGLNFPIDASTYRYIAFRMSVGTNNNVQFIWNRETIYDATTTTAFNVGTTLGYRIYLVDLAGLQTIGAGKVAWSGLMKALRMNLTFAPAGEQIRLDWVRLVNAGSAQSCRTVNWSGAATVDIYVTDAAGTSLGKIASGVSQNTASPGCTATGNGYAYYAGALAPGTYRVGVSAVGGTQPTSTSAAGTTWVVNDIPTLAFTSPDPEGSADDFATTFLNNPWDMNALTDLDLITNVNGAQITSVPLETPAGTSLGTQQVFLGTSASAASTGSIVGDPYVDPLFVTKRGFNTHIDTTRYRILTLEMGIPNLARDILDGSIARIVWRVAGQATENVSDDIIFNHRLGANVLDKIIVDLADRNALSLEPGSPSGWENGTTPNPGLDIFRIDPHEFSDPTNFYIKRVKLAALETASTSYVIRWQYVDTQPGTVSLYYNTTNTGACASGTPIASNVTASAGQATWTVGPVAVANGTYYVCATFTDGTNANETYAKWPVVVDHAAQNLPNMFPNRSMLNFGVQQRPNASFPLVGTSSQTVRVNLTGGSSACWTVDNALPATYNVTINGTGCGSGSFTVSLNPANPFNVAGVGDATFTVRETVPNTIGNSPQSVRAFQRIIAAPTAPFGAVDTPLEGTTVSGSIAVTGWAADDIDVSTIAIYRDPVGAEAGLVFIGNAVRVDDARPDLEAALPEHPFNYRAGWGYLLLTNFLPGSGDGTYVLRIYATDPDGHQTLLGSRTIVGANSQATRPFGAIDTPAQGETISGPAYNNFGWVLVRGPHIASPALNGTASVSVLIDGAVVGSPSGWTNRSDLTALFPAATFPGITHAAGVYTFDTTAYANGVHTIAWLVTASNGEADGIGSRYFTVANGAAALTHGEGALAAPQSGRLGADFGRRAVTVGSIAIDGPKTILGRELERVVLDPFRGAKGKYDAYTVANGRLGALPIGAWFDTARGILYWQPGAGYIGAYDFVVVRDGRERVPVRVVLQPQRHHAATRRGLNVRFATAP